MSSLRKAFVKAVVGLAVSVCGIASAQAATHDFGCITLLEEANCAIAESQISMVVEGLDSGEVAFTFYNQGTEQSSIEGIYFDDGTLLGISRLIDADDGLGGLPGVDFTAGSATPAKLPGRNNIAPAFETTAGFLADSDEPTSHNGVNPGEWVTVIFDLQADGEYADVIAELGNGELRVGLHVIDFASGNSVSLVHLPVPVPLPAAWLLFLSGCLVFRVAKKVSVK